MARFEQFIIGHFPGYGSTLLKSEKVDELLSPRSWTRLRTQGGDMELELKKTQSDHLMTRTILWEDSVVAYSYLKPTRDEYGRPGVFNHTILVRFETLIDLLDPVTKIRPLFAVNLEKPPADPLPPLVVDI